MDVLKQDTNPPASTPQQSQTTSQTPAPTSQQPVKEEPKQPGTPVETGQPDTSAQLKQQVESSKKKSRVTTLTESVYNKQEELAKLIVESTNPNISGRRYAEIQTEINTLYKEAKDNLELLKKEAPNKANYNAVSQSIENTYSVYKEHRNAKQSEALGQDYIDPTLGIPVRAKSFSPEVARARVNAQVKTGKDALYEIENIS